MKRIEVSDEMYEFLMEMSKRMNTQDNRATATPFMYIIQVDKEIPCPDACGTTKLINNEGDEWDLEEAKEEYETEIREYFKVTDKEILSDKMIETYLIETEQACKVNYRIEQVPADGLNVNTFFTEEAVKRHIAQNHYHYIAPQVFIVHAWRNPEMEMIHKFLKELVESKEKEE